MTVHVQRRLSATCPSGICLWAIPWLCCGVPIQEREILFVQKEFLKVLELSQTGIDKFCSCTGSEHKADEAAGLGPKAVLLYSAASADEFAFLSSLTQLVADHPSSGILSALGPQPEQSSLVMGAWLHDRQSLPLVAHRMKRSSSSAFQWLPGLQLLLFVLFGWSSSLKRGCLAASFSLLMPCNPKNAFQKSLCPLVAS